MCWEKLFPFEIVSCMDPMNLERLKPFFFPLQESSSEHEANTDENRDKRKERRDDVCCLNTGCNHV